MICFATQDNELYIPFQPEGVLELVTDRPGADFLYLPDAPYYGKNAMAANWASFDLSTLTHAFAVLRRDNEAGTWMLEFQLFNQRRGGLIFDGSGITMDVRDIENEGLFPYAMTGNTTVHMNYGGRTCDFVCDADPKAYNATPPVYDFYAKKETNDCAAAGKVLMEVDALEYLPKVNKAPGIAGTHKNIDLLEFHFSMKGNAKKRAPEILKMLGLSDLNQIRMDGTEWRSYTASYFQTHNGKTNA